MTNTDRQVLGEQVAYQLVITLLVHQQCVRSGDQSQLGQLKQSAATMMKQYGVDMTRIKLTDQEFRAGS